MALLTPYLKKGAYRSVLYWSVSRTTATRRIKTLIQQGKLVRVGKTRSTRFRLP